MVKQRADCETMYEMKHRLSRSRPCGQCTVFACQCQNQCKHGAPMRTRHDGKPAGEQHACIHAGMNASINDDAQRVCQRVTPVGLPPFLLGIGGRLRCWHVFHVGMKGKREMEKEAEAEQADITGIELFAGGGGLALGLGQAGIKDLAFVELNKTACDTLRANRPGWNVIEGDVHDVDFKEYKGKVDVVSGGAPCQSFSYAGKRLGFGDIRGTLFAEFARCVRETEPRMFLFENVLGLLSHDDGRTFRTILHVFEGLGYQVQHRVLNAAYYGVGQKRQRLIVIGIRNDLKDSIRFEYPSPDDHMTVLKDILKDVPESPYQPYSEKKRKVMELVPPGGCWVDLPESVAKAYMGKSHHSGGGKRGMARRLSWDEPCLTLTTSPSQKQTERCHPDETRPFTVREYARIQSFPDDLEIRRRAVRPIQADRQRRPRGAGEKDRRADHLGHQERRGMMLSDETGMCAARPAPEPDERIQRRTGNGSLTGFKARSWSRVRIQAESPPETPVNPARDPRSVACKCVHVLACPTHPPTAHAARVLTVACRITAAQG